MIINTLEYGEYIYIFLQKLAGAFKTHFFGKQRIGEQQTQNLPRNKFVFGSSLTKIIGYATWVTEGD
jgi:hypothetical protein